MVELPSPGLNSWTPGIMMNYEVPIIYNIPKQLFNLFVDPYIYIWLQYVAMVNEWCPSIYIECESVGGAKNLMRMSLF